MFVVELAGLQAVLQLAEELVEQMSLDWNHQAQVAACPGEARSDAIPVVRLAAWQQYPQIYPSGQVATSS